jgi:hypothetical protein
MAGVTVLNVLDSCCYGVAVAYWKIPLSKQLFIPQDATTICTIFSKSNFSFNFSLINDREFYATIL